MKHPGIGLIVIAVVLALGAVLATPRLSRWWVAPQHGYCPICQRHEHGDSVVKVRIEGEEAIEACCMSCALSYGRQTSRPVTIVSVTDHQTGKALDPESATFVLGSDVSPCTHASEPMRMAGETLPVHWDRCLPSVLAFASRDAADTFQTQHGGRLRSLQELQRQSAQQQALH